MSLCGRSVPAIAATTAAATAAAAAITTAATETAAAGAALPRFVDGQRPASELTPVQVANRAVGVLGRSHLHETETARAAGVAIRDELDLDHVAAVLAEELADLIVVRTEGTIADLQSRTHARTSTAPGREPKPGPDPRTERSAQYACHGTAMVMARNSVVSVR